MDRFLATCLFLGTSALLVSARFGFVWAGGDGYVTPLEALVVVVEGDVYFDRAGEVRAVAVNDAMMRGEILKTGGNSRVLLKIGTDVYVVLDERGELALDRAEPSLVSVGLTVGRVLGVSGISAEILRVTTNHTASWVPQGALTVVNYDFLETVSVVPFNTAVSVVVEPDIAFISSRATNIHETPPVRVEDAAFNAEAVSFYDWAERRIGHRLMDL